MSTSQVLQDLHQDVRDLLPCDVNLDPHETNSQRHLDVFKLASSEGHLSQVWSESAKLLTTLTRRSVGPFAAQNQLTLQCALFCRMLSGFRGDRYNLFTLYVVATLCHQAGVAFL